MLGLDLAPEGSLLGQHVVRTADPGGPAGTVLEQTDTAAEVLWLATDTCTWVPLEDLTRTRERYTD